MREQFRNMNEQIQPSEQLLQATRQRMAATRPRKWIPRMQRLTVAAACTLLILQARSICRRPLLQRRLRCPLCGSWCWQSVWTPA